MATKDTLFNSRIGVANTLFLISPLISAVAGVMLIGVGVTSYQKTKLTESWPSTMGTVKNARMRRYNDEGRIQYAPEVEYHFSVGGEAYTSSTIRSEIFVHFDKEDEARQFLSRYPAEGEVLVYYNPNDPQESVLEAKAAPLLHFVTALGVSLCGVAVITYYSYYRGLKARGHA